MSCDVARFIVLTMQRYGTHPAKSIRLTSVDKPLIIGRFSSFIINYSLLTLIVSDVIININGGNNQILPNATEAVQNFYGDRFSEHPVPDEPAKEIQLPEAQKLALYINKECLDRYLALIGECRSATELAKVVVEMVEQEPKLFPEEMVKERFIKLLLPFASKLEKGKTIDNIRARINDAWMNRPKKRP